MQYVFIIVIVVAAGAYVTWHLYRTLTGKGGCGEGSCRKGCPFACTDSESK